jgi:hypothetical protein
MYLGRDFSPQEFGESEVFGMDFVNDLDDGEQLLSSTWTISVTQGQDPNPKVHLQGPPLIVVPLGSNLKTATIQRIGGLWANVTYVVQAVVVTDRANTRNLWTHIRGVREDVLL